MTPEGLERYITGAVLVHRIAKWWTEPREGVHYHTVCDFAGFKPYDQDPMWGDTKIDQVVTCLWCVTERGNLGYQYRELP